MGALLGHHGLLLAGGAGGTSYQTETTTWENRIIALGSSVTTSEKDLADALVVQIKAASYVSKIKYLLPFIGATIACHRVPLIDVFNKGAAGSSGFTDADCDTATGLVNTAGSAKILNTFIQPSTLGGVSLTGGMGISLRAWTNGTAVEPCGAYDTGGNRWVLDMRSSLEALRWADVSTAIPQTASAAAAAHYYGQCASSTDRKLAKNGSVIATSTTSKTLATCDQEIRVGGCIDNGGALTYTKGTYGFFYATDGTLASGDISALHTLLNTYLITPTGR